MLYTDEFVQQLFSLVGEFPDDIKAAVQYGTNLGQIIYRPPDGDEEGQGQGRGCQ